MKKLLLLVAFSLSLVLIIGACQPANGVVTEQPPEDVAVTEPTDDYDPAGDMELRNG